MEGVRFSRVAAAGVSLHVAEAGPVDGPLLVLLHGFPEHWRAWRDYLGPLAAAGWRVVAPDQRGYGLSDKPKGLTAYALDILAQDVLALADHYGAARLRLVGHDWGASVGWWLATRWPERVERLVLMNAPHPAVWAEGMRDDPDQRRMSGYVRFFSLPILPEALLRAGNFAALASGFSSAARPDAFPPEELTLYRQAWSQPGALTGMLNWYRALLRRPPASSARMRVEPPLLLIWGERDRFGVRRLAERSLALCAAGQSLFLPEATHWAQHDAPQACLPAMLDFLGPPVQLST